MNIIFLLYCALALLPPVQTCDKKISQTKYKGRLEIAGICHNYTIKLLEGEIDTSKISTSWTDPWAGKTYSNVFALGSPCSWPDSLMPGVEFYFYIDTVTEKDCVTCMAYYPTPPKKLSIIVTEK